MRAPRPTSEADRRGPGRFGARLAALALSLAVAAPVFATVWTRSNVDVRIPKGGRAAIENASYSGRDWSVALTGLEVKEEGRTADSVTLVWTFSYTNTDKEAHYVALAVRCLDSTRNERSRFAAKATLQAETSAGERVEIRVKSREADWRNSVWARIVVDFLSSAEG